MKKGSIMNNKIFIHLIKSPLGFYFYDVNRNDVIQISGELYRFLLNEKYNYANANIEKEFSELKEYGYLSEVHPKVIEDGRGDEDELEYYLNNKLEQLTLQITQGCNFRCSYCGYSQQDNFNRNHSAKKMTYEMARQAVDFFADKAKDSGHLNISFYGGEPLLEYNMIIKIIKYTKIRLEGREISYNLTTNATLLTVQRLDELLKYNVNVLVSFDGNKENHNRGRKFAKNGYGTFDEVMAALKRIKDESPLNYEKLSFNCVVDPLADYAKTKKIFKSKMFCENDILTPILEPCTGSLTILSDEFDWQYRTEMFLALLAYQGAIDKAEIGALARNYLSYVESYNKKMEYTYTISSKMGRGGPCYSGVKDLFVNADGNFYPCEKVNEKSEVACIGNLYEGFNIDNIRKQLNIGALTEENCKKCWVISQCTICIKQADAGKYIATDLIRRQCKNVIDTCENNLKTYIALKETNSIYTKIYNGGSESGKSYSLSL